MSQMRIAILLISACLTAPVFASDPADRMVGRWKYSPEKSQVPEETIATAQWMIEKFGPYTTRTTSDQILTSREKTHHVTTSICDGKEHHGFSKTTKWVEDIRLGRSNDARSSSQHCP